MTAIAILVKVVIDMHYYNLTHRPISYHVQNIKDSRTYTPEESSPFYNNQHGLAEMDQSAW
jgi:hypothetical protein